ncbi:MAG: cadherin domain-containing protein, partial [Nitrospira sp.]|nr:cadherin domain-containing protein [Nitrospira sp.]
ASNGGTTAFSSATDTVDVIVTAVNDAPTALALSANTVAENAANGTVVGTVTVTDPDAGDTKTYSLTDSAGGRFAIDGSTGQITVADGSLLDYENTPSHDVTVRVTDSGGLTYDETFAINLTNVNEAPTGISLSGNTVEENAANGTMVGTASTMDQDAGDSHTYQLMDNAGGRFAINSSTGQITVADGSLLDYESTPSHDVTVRVTDSGGLTYGETFAINLTNVNEAPTGADATVTINEDTSHTLTTANFGFSDVDTGDNLSAVRIETLPSAGSLTISGVAVMAGQVVAVSDITAGQLMFTPAADANGTGYANFTFSVRDSNNAYDAAPNTFIFNVTAVNDAPVNQVPGAQTVNEDTPLSLSGLSVNDVDGNLSTVQLAVGNGTLNVTLSGAATITSGDNGTNILTLSGSQADLNATLASLVYQGSLNYTGADTLTVISTDSNAMTDVDTVAITVTAVNDAPTDLSLSANTVAENAANGTVVGTVSAVDPDRGDTKSYSLTDTAGGRFAINSSTGVLTVADGSLLNYEAVTSHNITVRVTDSGGLTYDKTFTITLTDAYEPLPPPNMSSSSGASHAIVARENRTALPSLPDVSSETGKAEFRPSEDLRKAIEIMTETPLPIDSANLEEKHVDVVREQFFGKVESTIEEKEFLPAPVSESKTEGKVTAQDHGDSALLISDHHVDSQQLDRTSESAIGTTMAVGLAGVVLQRAMGTKERLIANIRRSREHTEGASPDMESELSSEGDSRSLRNESEHDGPISSKPGAA